MKRDMDFSLSQQEKRQEENRKVLTFFFLFCPTEIFSEQKNKKNKTFHLSFLSLLPLLFSSQTTTQRDDDDDE